MSMQALIALSHHHRHHGSPWRRGRACTLDLQRPWDLKQQV